MDSNLETKLAIFKRSEARSVMVEFLQHELNEICKGFMSCSEEMFKQHKGRALQLKELIEKLNK